MNVRDAAAASVESADAANLRGRLSDPRESDAASSAARDAGFAPPDAAPPTSVETGGEFAAIDADAGTKPVPSKPVVSDETKDGAEPVVSATPQAKPTVTRDASVAITKPPAAVDAGAPRPVVVDASTQPVSASACMAGRYTGSFQGKIVQTRTSATTTLDGTIELDLALAEGGSALNITRGVVVAKDSLGSPVRVELDGSVDCASKELRSGVLKGRYGSDDDPTGIDFAGTASGTYETDPAALRGGWNVDLADLGVKADGTYGTTLQK